MKEGRIRAGIVLFVAAVLFIFSSVAFAGDIVPAKEAVKYLDKNRYTKAQIKEYYSSIKGKTIKGTGTIAEVKPARKNYELCVMVTGTTYDRSCNLVVSTDQKDALNLKKGQKVSFEGQFVRLTPFVNYYVIIKGKYSK